MSDNVVKLPPGWGLLSDHQLMEKGKFVKVSFPCNDDAIAGGITRENMWCEIMEGDKYAGVGRLDNIPEYSDFHCGEIITYGSKLGQTFGTGSTHPQFLKRVEEKK